MNWLDWHASQRSFTDLALVRREAVNFSLGAGVGAPERLRGLRASSGFLSVLGVEADDRSRFDVRLTMWQARRMLR